MRPYSFSRVDTFIQCGEKYRLKYVEGRREDTPAWWSVAGDGVHLSTEEFDRHGMENFDSVDALWQWAFNVSIAKKAKLSQVDPKDWRTNSKNQDESYWREMGAAHVQNYIDWRKATGWEVLGIEYKVFGQIAGIDFIGYIDRVFVTDDGEAIIVDLKSGSRVSYLQTQQALYRELLIQSHGVTADLGAFFKTAPSKTAMGLTKPVDLTKYTPLLEQYALGVLKAEESGLFLPNPTYFCGTCDVRAYCSAADVLPSPTTGKRKPTLKPIKINK